MVFNQVMLNRGLTMHHRRTDEHPGDFRPAALVQLRWACEFVLSCLLISPIHTTLLIALGPPFARLVKICVEVLAQLVYRRVR